MSERFVCTKADPWTPEKGKYAVHPGAVTVGDQENDWPSGDVQAYECPFCHKQFEVELPQ